jgi:hypothetical protein
VTAFCINKRRAGGGVQRQFESRQQGFEPWRQQLCDERANELSKRPVCYNMTRGNLGARVISQQCAAERILVMKLLRGGEPFRNGIYTHFMYEHRLRGFTSFLLP